MFYDITASSDERVVDKSWVSRVAEVIDIPFCVAGGIKSVEDARQILEFGADKVSINSPALADPPLSPDWPSASACSAWWWASTPILMRRAVTIRSNSLPATSRTRTTAWHTLDWVEEAQNVAPVKSC